MTNAEPIDLHRTVLGIESATGRIVPVPQEPGRPPKRIEGRTVGVSTVEGEGPHGGERHPDGDELLYVISGSVLLHLDLDEGTRDVTLEAGQAIVVPQGTWHRLVGTGSPAEVLNITPGPHGEARPRQR